MAGRWEVTTFTIETSTPDHVTDTLFANGYMQVPVIVSIRAKDPVTNDAYTLSPSELEGTQLVDYYNPTSSPQGWTKTTVENDFHHVMPGKLDDSKPPSAGLSEGDPSAALQKIKFWVSTTKVEHLNMGAKIRQGNGFDVDTSGRYGNIDSHVTLTAVTPVRYRVSDLTIEKVEVNSGVLNPVPVQPPINWAQYNYYVSSKGHAFLKSLAHNVNIGGRDSGQRNSYVWAPSPMGHVVYLHYAWTIGPPTKQRVGLVSGNFGIMGLDVQIDIRQRPSAVNFTLMTLWGEKIPRMYSPFFKLENRWIEVWDIYGNRCTFRQSWREPTPDEIMFQDYDGPADSDENSTPGDGAEPEA